MSSTSAVLTKPELDDRITPAVTRPDPRCAASGGVPVPGVAFRQAGRRDRRLPGAVGDRSPGRLVDEVFLPPFTTVVGAFLDLIGNGQLADHLAASLSRALVGFFVAVAIAVPLGVAIGWYKPVADLLNPILEVFRNTAALALLPVFILILGLGETSKVALVIYACTFPILLNTISGVRTVDPLLVKSARSLGLPAHRLFQKVVLPAAVPTIFTGVRMAAASSILVLIAAEMVGAKAGLGYLITASQLNFRIPDMYAGIIAISLVGLVFNGVLVAIERRLSRWRADQ